MNRRTFTRHLLEVTAAMGLGTAGSGSGRGSTSGRPRRAGGDPFRVDPVRLVENFEGLQRFGGRPDGGLDRPAYSDADLEARAYVTEVMRRAGLEVAVDAGGNLLGRREGERTDLPPLLFGSHIDSVPGGGHFDGQVGSMAAIEAAHALADHGIQTRHPLEVVIFQNEEGGLYGSRILAGSLDLSELDIVSASGLTIREGIARIGGDPDRLHEAARRPGTVAAYVELHIEQGSVLDAEGIDVGIVEGIVGIRWWDVTVDGFANHAGTTPMDRRQDALLAAARYVEAVNRIVRERDGAQVGTVGRISAEPGAPNVIPGRVRTTLELRDLRMDVIEELYDEIQRASDAIAADTGTTFTFERTVDLAPAPADPTVRESIRAAAHGLGLTTHDMPSGAGHDAQSLAPIAPIGMIFVPSVDGVSHSPAEYTRPEDIVNGANVLLNTLMALDAG